MIILKCPEYLCLRICSVDDTKVDVDWIYTRSKLILQPETNEHRTKKENKIHRKKTRQQNTPHEDETTKHTVRRREIKTKKYVKIILFYYKKK
jgi:hypothetical protein